MAKYLIQANYSPEGLQGVLRDGGSSRVAAVEKTIGGLGGTVEAFYYAFGETDVYVIADVPDNVSAAAIALTISATGRVACKTTVLLTPGEIDQATQKSVDYKAPGG
jgi:uncharacterized protein with GYD domain